MGTGTGRRGWVPVAGARVAILACEWPTRCGLLAGTLGLCLVSVHLPAHTPCPPSHPLCLPGHVRKPTRARPADRLHRHPRARSCLGSGGAAPCCQATSRPHTEPGSRTAPRPRDSRHAQGGPGPRPSSPGRTTLRLSGLHDQAGSSLHPAPDDTTPLRTGVKKASHDRSTLDARPV